MPKMYRFPEIKQPVQKNCSGQVSLSRAGVTQVTLSPSRSSRATTMVSPFSSREMPPDFKQWDVGA